MRKNFGKQSWVIPLPVLIIGTYDEDGNADAMNAAWGGIYKSGEIMLSLGAGHRTTKNIRATEAFTVSFADADHVIGADYVGLVSGNDVPGKVQRAGFTPQKSECVNAPLFAELPVAAECRLVKINEDGVVIGEVVNVCADESILGEDGSIDMDRLRPITFDSVHQDYRVLGEKVGNAFEDGNTLQ